MAAPCCTAEEPSPVASWDFGSEEATPLEPHGGVHRDQPGPRPPEFPDFDSQNTAVLLDGKGARFTVEDPGHQSRFDFANSDEITLEAWVKIHELKRGENLYVIGKGRTGAPQFARDNQNWALRVREAGGQARASFLFATPISKKQNNRDGHWHRWTASKGFDPKSGWHHIAVAYRFGEPESIRGWLDGEPVTGEWDMGGATAESPVVDNDEVWIGSSQAGHASNSFRGLLDSIAVHRKRLDDKVMKGRFRRDDSAVKKPTLAVESLPELGKLPDGEVLITLHEAITAHDRWLNEDESFPAAIESWTSRSFLLPRLPLRFDDWGIREAWNAPVLVRMAADVKLEPGPRQFMLRARGLSRLWVDGKVIARTKPIVGSPSGEEPITPVAEPPRPGLRRAGHRQQEAFGDAVIGVDGIARIVLESVVGGKKFRAEPGELCVAVSTAEQDSLVLLQPAQPGVVPIALTDHQIEPLLETMEAELHARDDATRRTKSASQDRFWDERHEWARRQYVADHDPRASIDSFLDAKIATALNETSTTDPKTAEQFHEKVFPILSEHCLRCHGDKDSGGLRLNSREAFLKGGDSELPAFMPGDVAGSEAIARIRSDDEDIRMPPTGEPLSKKEIQTLERWVNEGAIWAGPRIEPNEVAQPAIIDDAAFLRRATLDTIGLPPTEAEVRTFLADSRPDKRSRAIDRLLADERWADHWVSYWQDVLAENPTLINMSLNSTGPFRWFLWDSLRDNKAIDRWVTELIMMRGGAFDGGSAGFGLAGDNDAPLATKGQILASAFLGVELQCARCHDSPYHSTKQKDLYSLAAMLDRKALTVPKSSMVPLAFFEKKARESLIRATLKPDESIAPEWPFSELSEWIDAQDASSWLQNPKDTREQLCGLITGPQNTRFPKVVVNRLWRRMMGAGIVEPPQDWEGKQASHPELLDWLAKELVMNRYDVKHVLRLILNSQAYQREAKGYNLAAEANKRFFQAPDRRRLTAEQIVDSMYAAAGASIDIEELTFDPDGRRPASNRLSLGKATRAWMLVSLNNERDRPSLTLPRAQVLDDVLTAFGWSGARQMPRTDRENASNVLQPGVLANGTLTSWISSASYQSELAQLAIRASSPQALVETLFLRFLGRMPSDIERASFAEPLTPGFAGRLIAEDQVEWPKPLPILPRVTWSNHLVSESTTIQNENERRARNGLPPDPRLEPSWREILEDAVWSLINHREFVWVP